ncbi:NfeD family protein [Corynebacterium spheniscorum]|uniref:Membrane protein implicated in regulation of membrane protease activity n=1 Tax=Corynebacterium spheniscorum TaxID=185761 RepID=A0A1I2SYG9_9CORY|nr:NfeD family protein [Corynebacterium spheniscorum]KAA8724278.1 NfeD family protein [Corynebacterium spheniscorum]SFG56969.1 Membrane protein implicated in regulation of membrane protease activity [Corynebacterium spheniscorum]
MSALVWFIIALVLAGLELAAGEFTLLMLAGGALAASGVALFAPPAASVAAFAIASIGLLLFLRPFLRKRLTHPDLLDTTPTALVGRSATVLEAIEPGSHTGQIRVNGEIWTAESMDPSTDFRPGDRVTVVRIADGTTAVVWKES